MLLLVTFLMLWQIWKKDKPGLPPLSTDKSMKRNRDDSDVKRPRKRVKAKVEEADKEGGQKSPKCGYCGLEGACQRNSNLCDKCYADIREGNGSDSPSTAAAFTEDTDTGHQEKEKQVNF